MYLIKIFCDFCDSKSCKKTFEHICDAANIDFYGADKNVFFTEDDDYTHAIIMNKATPILNIPKANVIGLAFEPYEFLGINENFVNYAKKYIGKYFIGDKRGLPDPFIEHFGYMWHSNPKRDIIDKPKLMSICVSNKRQAPGHIYRHMLIEKIIKYDLPIDIYGYGSDSYNYKYSKGTFIDAEPYTDYLFSICIENYQNNDYISEKIITPLLHNCMPIYIGCKKITSYFGDNVILLSGNPDKDINILISILKEPLKYYKKTYTEKNIKTVNLIHNIDTLFSS